MPEAQNDAIGLGLIGTDLTCIPLGAYIGIFEGWQRIKVLPLLNLVSPPLYF